MVTRLLFRFMLLIPLPFVVFIVLAGWLGTLRPPHPALMGFIEGCEGKPQPCWYGIVPGQISIDDANRLIENLPHKTKTVTGIWAIYQLDDCKVRLPAVGKGALDHFSLDSCREIQAGDLVSVLGSPKGVAPVCGGIAYFRWDRLQAWGGRESPRRLSPRYKITIIAVSQDDTDFAPVMYKWHGFTAYSLYKQLQPDIKIIASCPIFYP